MGYICKCGISLFTPFLTFFLIIFAYTWHIWYFYGHFNFYHFLPILDPFWPFVIFWVNFLYSVICSYINYVIMQKIALINGISIGIFNFYHFFTYFGPFLTFFWPFVIFCVNFQ